MILTTAFRALEKNAITIAGATIKHSPTISTPGNPGKRVRQRHVFIDSRRPGRDTSLNSVPQLGRDNGFMQTIDKQRSPSVNVALGGGDAINNDFLSLITTPTHFTDVGGVLEHIADCIALPTIPGRRGDPESVKTVGDSITTDHDRIAVLAGIAVGVQAEDHTDYGSLILDNTESEALAILDMDTLITVGSTTGDNLTLLYSSKTTGIKAAVYRSVFLTGHKKPELKILFIELVGRIIDFHGSNDASAGILKGAGNCALVDSITTGKALDLHHEDT